MDTFEPGDLHVSGNFKNGASEDAYVNSENKYLNQYMYTVCKPMPANTHMTNWPLCDA